MGKTGILFDLDGTLLNTLEDLCDATNYALACHGYPSRTLEEVRSFVGNGVRQLIDLAVPHGTDPEPVLQSYQQYYPTHCRIKTRPYDGILEALEVLSRKYPLAVVSNKPDYATKSLCADYFPGLWAIGEQPGILRKPAPDMLFAAMQVLGADHYIYVGDSEVDIFTAKNASIPCLSVTWGFREEGFLRSQGGVHFCHSPALLPQALEEIIKERDISHGK